MKSKLFDSKNCSHTPNTRLWMYLGLALLIWTGSPVTANSMEYEPLSGLALAKTDGTIVGSKYAFKKNWTLKTSQEEGFPQVKCTVKLTYESDKSYFLVKTEGKHKGDAIGENDLAYLVSPSKPLTLFSMIKMKQENDDKQHCLCEKNFNSNNLDEILKIIEDNYEAFNVFDENAIGGKLDELYMTRVQEDGFNLDWIKGALSNDGVLWDKITEDGSKVLQVEVTPEALNKQINIVFETHVNRFEKILNMLTVELFADNLRHKYLLQEEEVQQSDGDNEGNEFYEIDQSELEEGSPDQETQKSGLSNLTQSQEQMSSDSMPTPFSEQISQDSYYLNQTGNGSFYSSSRRILEESRKSQALNQSPKANSKDVDEDSQRHTSQDKSPAQEVKTQKSDVSDFKLVEDIRPDHDSFENTKALVKDHESEASQHPKSTASVIEEKSKLSQEEMSKKEIMQEVAKLEEEERSKSHSRKTGDMTPFSEHSEEVKQVNEELAVLSEEVLKMDDQSLEHLEQELLEKMTDVEKKAMRLFKKVPGQVTTLLKKIQEQVLSSSPEDMFKEMFDKVEQQIETQLEKSISKEHQQLNLMAMLVKNMTLIAPRHQFSEMHLGPMVMQVFYRTVFNIFSQRIKDAIESGKFAQFMIDEDILGDLHSKLEDITGEKIEVKELDKPLGEITLGCFLDALYKVLGMIDVDKIVKSIVFPFWRPVISNMSKMAAEVVVESDLNGKYGMIRHDEERDADMFQTNRMIYFLAAHRESSIYSGREKVLLPTFTLCNNTILLI